MNFGRPSKTMVKTLMEDSDTKIADEWWSQDTNDGMGHV